MRLGICTTDFKAMSVNQLFDRVASYGFEAVQLSFASVAETGFEADGRLEIPAEVPPGVIRTIADAAASRSLSIVAVNGTFNMAHPDRAVRDEGVRRFEGFAAAVAALGAPIASICTRTRCAEDLWTFHPDTASDAAWDDMMEVARAIAAIARRHGIRLGIETEASNVISTPERARRLIDEVGADVMCVVMDCANLFHAGQARRDRVADVIGHAFDVLGDDVALAHGKDILASDGLRFCAAGDGIVDFDLFLMLLAKYGYRGDMVLHGAHGHASVARAAAFLRARIAESGQ